MISAQVREIARWEFRRFFKPKQMLAGLLFMLGGLAVGMLLGRAGTRAAAESIDVPVLGADWSEAAWAAANEQGRLVLAPRERAEEAALREAVADGDVAAFVIADGAAEFRIVMRRSPSWRASLERAIGSAQRVDLVLASGLTAEQMAALGAAPRITPEHLERERGAGDRVAGFAAVFFIVIGAMTGMGYIFASITAEKQNRVTEQIVSAVTPQQWMDGKIIGLSAVTMVSVLNLVMASVMLLFILRLLGRQIPMPATVADPLLIALFFCFMILGFLFWFIFLAVVAAMIDDPNNSSRTQMILLPVLSAAAAGLVLVSPDTTLVRVLSLVPPTSAAVMPARLLLGDVIWWEWIAALGLLVAAIYLLRRLAARVFHLVMLMYGKEPTWAEVRRWARAADAR